MTALNFQIQCFGDNGTIFHLMHLLLLRSIRTNCVGSIDDTEKNAMDNFIIIDYSLL